MKLSRPPLTYSADDQANVRHVLEQEDAKNIKLGRIQDNIILRDTVTGAAVILTVASGSVVIT